MNFLCYRGIEFTLTSSDNGVFTLTAKQANKPLLSSQVSHQAVALNTFHILVVVSLCHHLLRNVRH
jgi:hypothetical protein